MRVHNSFRIAIEIYVSRIMKNIWGLSIEIIEELGNELLSFYDQVKPLFKTTTRDVSHHGLTGVKGGLLMEGKRTYTEVSRKIVDP